MTVFTYHNLYLAYLECRKHKRATRNALLFEWRMETELKRLLRELQNRDYCPGQSLCFVVTNPKPREIFAADFRDRVVHHLFVRELLPSAERRFLDDSFACRPGKGTHRAVDQLRRFIRRAALRRLYFLKLDVKAFFPSIDKSVLFGMVERLIRKNRKCDRWTDEMLWLAQCIIFHDPTLDYRYRGDPKLRRLVPEGKSLLFLPKGKGLPIGNHTSQFFANLYLDELDHFIKRELRCAWYIRYADDLLLLDPDPVRLRAWRRSIDRFLRTRLSMRLHPGKTALQSVKRGIDFLGYFVKPDHVSVRRSVIHRVKRRIADFRHDPDRDEERFLSALNSYLGHFEYAKKLRS